MPSTDEQRLLSILVTQEPIRKLHHFVMLPSPQMALGKKARRTTAMKYFYLKSHMSFNSDCETMSLSSIDKGPEMEIQWVVVMCPQGETATCTALTKRIKWYISQLQMPFLKAIGGGRRGPGYKRYGLNRKLAALKLSKQRLPVFEGPRPRVVASAPTQRSLWAT